LRLLVLPGDFGLEWNYLGKIRRVLRHRVAHGLRPRALPYVDFMANGTADMWCEMKKHETRDGYQDDSDGAGEGDAFLQAR
jgi:hypothetical protein